jgi:hypothetical protein
VETKNGDEEEAVTAPENPGLHVQPSGTLNPMLLAGQGTAGRELKGQTLGREERDKESSNQPEHELEKNGLDEVAKTTPENPALQEHPPAALGTAAPVLKAGHPTASV